MNGAPPPQPLQSFHNIPGGQPSGTEMRLLSVTPSSSGCDSGRQAKTGELCQSEYTKNPVKVLSVLMLAYMPM